MTVPSIRRASAEAPARRRKWPGGFDYGGKSIVTIQHPPNFTEFQMESLFFIWNSLKS